MKKLGNKIEKVLSANAETFRVKLRFTDGVVGEVDLSAIFEHPKALAAEVVRGQLFAKCFVESGGLAWPNGLEFCADALKMKLITKKRNKAA